MAVTTFTVQRPNGTSFEVMTDTNKSTTIKRTLYGAGDSSRAAVGFILMVDAIPALLAQAEDIVNDSRYKDETKERIVDNEARQKFRDDEYRYDQWRSAHDTAQLAWDDVQTAAENLLEHADKLREIADLAEQALSERPEDREAAKEQLKEMLSDPALTEEMKQAIRDFIEALEIYGELALSAFYWFFGYLPCTQAAADWCGAGNHPDCWYCSPDPCLCTLVDQESGEPWQPNGSAGGGEGGGGAPREPETDQLPPGFELLASEVATQTEASQPKTQEEIPGVPEAIEPSSDKGRFAYATDSQLDDTAIQPAGGRSTVGDLEERTRRPTFAARKDTVVEHPEGTHTTGAPSTTIVPCTTCEIAVNSIKGPAKTLAGLQEHLDCLWTAASLTKGASGRPLTDGLDRTGIDAALDSGPTPAGHDALKSAMADLINELFNRCAQSLSVPGSTSVPLQGKDRPDKPAESEAGPSGNCWTRINAATSIEELRAIRKEFPIKDGRLDKLLATAGASIDTIKSRLRVFCIRALAGGSAAKKNPTEACKAAIARLQELERKKDKGFAEELVNAIVEHAPQLLQDEAVMKTPMKLFDGGDAAIQALAKTLMARFSAWCAPPEPEEEAPKKKSPKTTATSKGKIANKAKAWFPKPETKEDRCRTYMLAIMRAIDRVKKTGNFSTTGKKSYSKALSTRDGGSLAPAIRPEKLAALMAQESSFGNHPKMNAGSYRGWFQIGEAAVKDYNRHNGTSLDWEQMGTDFDAAATVAAWYLASLAQQLTFAEPGAVTDQEEANKFVLAAYNAGMGHVRKARLRAKENGEDFNKWSVVRQYLGHTLSDEKLDEVVAYVWNIRYFERLLEYWSCKKRARGGR